MLLLQEIIETRNSTTEEKYAVPLNEYLAPWTWSEHRFLFKFSYILAAHSQFTNFVSVFTFFLNSNFSLYSRINCYLLNRSDFISFDNTNIKGNTFLVTVSVCQWGFIFVIISDWIWVCFRVIYNTRNAF